MHPFGGSNFASFDEEGFWLPELAKFNIFIGKNNAGKSNVLKFIKELGKFAYEPGKSFVDPLQRHWDKPIGSIVKLGVTLEDLEVNPNPSQLSPADKHYLISDKKIYALHFDPRKQEILPPNPFENNRRLAHCLAKTIGLRADGENYLERFQKYIPRLIRILSREFKAVFFVPQFREFRYETGDRGYDGKTYLDHDNVGGYKLPERLAWMKSPGVKHNREKARFRAIEASVKKLLGLPDLEIDFEDSSGSRPRAVILNISGLRRYLESFGSGIHQLVILCFALSLRENSVICIEEPESFQHPGLQRRFFDFLRTTSNTYFITTHSNVFLDYAKHEDTRVYHTGYFNRATRVGLIDTTPRAYEVLNDLQCHASDLMQANGVIWVEGPTDRLFLLRWLDLLGMEYKEGTQFAIVFYGGNLLSHITFDPEHALEHLVPLLRVNRNAVVVLDSDRKKKYQRLSKGRRELVSRIEAEIESGRGWLWLTRGREVENYLSEATLRRFCRSKFGDGYRLQFDQYLSPDEMIRYGRGFKRQFRYSSAKVKYCRELVPLIEKDDLSVLDLTRRLSAVIETIGKWNPEP